MPGWKRIVRIPPRLRVCFAPLEQLVRIPGRLFRPTHPPQGLDAEHRFDRAVRRFTPTRAVRETSGCVLNTACRGW